MPIKGIVDGASSFIANGVNNQAAIFAYQDEACGNIIGAQTLPIANFSTCGGLKKNYIVKLFYDYITPPPPLSTYTTVR
jgi:hypothetical protein